MSISPWKQNATRPTWKVTVLKRDKTALDITGATFAGKLRKEGNSVGVVCAGSYSITIASAGIFTYSPVAADVATAGEFDWQTTLTISGQTYIVTDRIVIEESF